MPDCAVCLLTAAVFILQVYQHSSTHLIIPQVLSSEKFLAACAAGESCSLWWLWEIRYHSYLITLLIHTQKTHDITPHILNNDTPDCSHHWMYFCNFNPIVMLPPPPGKWVVTPGFVLDSVKNGSWLAEKPYEISISTCSTSSYFPVRQWRKKVSSGQITGAFQGWTVLLMVQESDRRAMFTRWRVWQKSFFFNPNNLLFGEYNDAWD